MEGIGLAEIAGRHPVFVRRVEDLAWGEIDDEAQLQRILATVYPEIVKRETDEN